MKHSACQVSYSIRSIAGKALKLLVSNKVETNYEIALLILLNGGIWRLQFDLIHNEEQVKGRLFTYKLLVYRPYRRKVKEVEGLDVL